LSDAAEALVCEHCETTFRLRLENVRYRCIRCLEPVGPELGEEAETRYLYSMALLRGAPSSPSQASWNRPNPKVKPPTVTKIGRYTLEKEVGRGGMGVVYLAYDTGRDQHVALKVLLAGEFAHDQQRERFFREARAVSQLSHESLVEVLDIGEFGARPFFAMAFIEGVTLRGVLDNVTRLPPREACRIASQISRGLAAAHEAGFAHRDVKPSNILIEVDGRSYLSDFGLVIETDSSRLTQTGTVMGTPAYMAPELARADPDLDWPRSDVYAMGAVLYEMVTGHRPYDGEAGTQVLLDILTEPPIAAAHRLASLDRDLDIIIARAMARDVTYRYPSAEALADDLDHFIQGQAITAQALPRTYRAFQFAKQRRWPLMAVAATTLLTVLGTATVWGLQDLYDERANSAREDLAEVRLETMNASVDRLLEAEDLAQAKRVFSTYASADEHAGTRALAHAWLVQAERERDAGRLEEELTALGTAFTTTSDTALQEETLLQIAQTFRRQFWWERIDAALDRIHPVDREQQIAILDLRVETAIALRDLDRALDLFEQAEGEGLSLEMGHFKPLLQALAGGTPLGRSCGKGATVDINGDGRKEIVFLPNPVDESLVAFSPDTLKIVREHPFPASTDEALFALDDDQSLFVGMANGQARAFRWTPEGPTQIGQWEEEGALTSTAAVDVDSDGHANHFLGFGAYTRHLSEVRLDPLSAVSPHPSTDAVQSDIAAMIGMDLTRDGVEELVVAAGPWNAWDLRVLTAEGSDLRLLGRTKIGFVGGLARLRRGDDVLLVAAKSDLYPSIRDFPPDAPFGSPPGIYLFSWAQGDLIERAFLPASHPPGERTIRLSEPFVADLDADGRDDVIVNISTPAHSWMQVYRQHQDGSFSSVSLQGLRAISTSDDQLVVAETDPSLSHGAAWLLGRGDHFPSALPSDTHATTPIPDMPPIERGIWERAETLLQLSLTRQAAATLEDLGTLVDGTDTAGRAWLRAGGMREEARDPDAALRDYEEASKVEGVAPRALLASARLQYLEHRFDASHRIAERLRANADPTTQAAVEDLWPASEVFVPTSVITLEFDGPLAPHWQINPLAVRRDPHANTLLIDAATGQGTLARFPLHRVGPLALTVDFTVHRLEWASGVQILLRPRGSPSGTSMGIAVAGWGGGGLLDREVGCRLPAHPPLIGARLQADGAADRVVLRGELRSAKERDSLYCRILDDNGRTLHASRNSVAYSTETDEWELIIATAGDEAAGATMLSKIAISRITIEGVVPESNADDTRPNLVPNSFPTTPDGQIRALRTRRDSLMGQARTNLGADFFSTYAAAWLTAAEMHPNDPDIQQVLMSDLEGLESATPRSPDEHAMYQNLLYLRGRAQWRAGHPQAAMRDVDSVIARATEPTESNIFGVQFKAHRIAAAIAMSTTDSDAALAHVEDAILSAKSPELARDRLLLDTHFEGMREDPAWAPLFGSRPPPQKEEERTSDPNGLSD
jgi:hypothetical protein